MALRKLTLLALLTAFSLGLFTLELAIPAFPLCPAAKLGLANTVTLFMLVKREIFKFYEIFAVMAVRCFLAAVITGRLSAAAFSFCGGTFALAAMFLAYRFLFKNTAAVSICGAVFHNIGQSLVSIVFYGVYSVIYTIPMFFAAGVISGAVIGFAVMFIQRNKALTRYLNYNYINHEKERINGKSKDRKN